MTFANFVAAAAPEHRPLWEGVYRTAVVPDWARTPPSEERKLLALVEDWCIDTSSTIPVLARWTEVVPGLSLRLLRRDEHPAVMDRYLTNGARSIPVVLVMDRECRVIARWGPYPAPLAEWVREHKPPVMEKAEFVKGKRLWYARDRGETTLKEIAEVVRMQVAA
jgi:hypothetical protein